MTPRGERTADYDFDIPADRIALRPASVRDESRLLVVNRATESIEHRRFRDLASMIPAGDALVLNTSKVIRARLLGERESGAPAEVLLLAPHGPDTWEAMVRPGARLGPGRRVRIATDTHVRVVESGAQTPTLVRFESPHTVDEILARYGHMPLPPYIDRADDAADADRYQTVYARDAGSVAAPTAGLHMTQAVLESLAARGVRRVDLTLHVGAGTFKPVESDDPVLHRMHAERYSLTGDAATMLNDTRASGGHIWALGTTSLRVLETVVGADGRFTGRAGETAIFIRPPHVVRGADRLITNFHLPRSTLLMLVAAFAGYDLTRRVYDCARAEGYRFYSYGDAMCVL
jgi:S-adenosylmethionine:tRNA ribosyltransferase-isomerase